MIPAWHLHSPSLLDSTIFKYLLTMDELTQLLKDEQIQNKKSLSHLVQLHFNILKEHTLSLNYQYQTKDHHVQRTTKNMNFFSTVKQRIGKTNTALRRNMIESSSNNEDEICLKTPYKEDKILRWIKEKKYRAYKCTYCNKE